jgi:hypothetical protein
MEKVSPFKDKLQDTLTWWLGKRKPFIINDEYEIKLLFIDKINNSAKIEITNLKTQKIHVMEVSDEQ